MSFFRSFVDALFTPAPPAIRKGAFDPDCALGEYDEQALLATFIYIQRLRLATDRDNKTLPSLKHIKQLLEWDLHPRLAQDGKFFPSPRLIAGTFITAETMRKCIDRAQQDPNYDNYGPVIWRQAVAFCDGTLRFD